MNSMWCKFGDVESENGGSNETTLRFPIKMIIDRGKWDDFCQLTGMNPWARAEGLMTNNEMVSLKESEAKKLNLIS